MEENKININPRKKLEKYNVPIWHKVTLTIEEASAYSNIGISKLYEMTNKPTCSFVIHTGDRKRLIKRNEFEKYLSQNIEI